MKMKPNPAALTPQAIDSLLLDSNPWMSCEECFELTDGCVEDLLQGVRPRQALRVHLHACPACMEDVLSLLSLVAGDRGADPVPMARLLTP